MLSQYRNTLHHLALSGAFILSSLVAISSATAEEDDVNHKGTFLPSGLLITPTAVPKSAYQALSPDLPEFPKFVAGGAVSTAKSPNGNTLLVLAGGHNSLQDKKGNSFTNEYIFVFDISGGRSIKKQVIQIPNAFVGITFDHSGQNQTYLYVTEDNSDLVEIVYTPTNSLHQSVVASALAKFGYESALNYRGSTPKSAALTPDGSTLFVTLGGTNAISVIKGVPDHPQVVGLIPAGFQPNAVTLSNDGKFAYVADGKGVTGANPRLTYFNQKDPNQYVEELQKSYLQSFPIPNDKELAELTAQVARNNGYSAKLTPAEENLIHELQQRIKHVIYIVKENRTYDQILGDPDRGNGDPKLKR